MEMSDMSRKKYFHLSIGIVLVAVLLSPWQALSIIHAQGPVPRIRQTNADVMTMWEFYNKLGVTREKRTWQYSVFITINP